MKKIYCISGLGADDRVFKKLKIKNANLINLPWPDYERSDNLPYYAQRLSAMIEDDHPTILGLSFGGMLAIEIGKQRDVKQTILISSAKTKEEVPEFGRVVKALVVSELVPAFIYKTPNKILNEKFGVETEEDKELLKGILQDSDGQFMRWAMKAVSTWEGKHYNEPVLHIHGTSDGIIFPENVTPDYWIEGGGHMMVYQRAEEISNIINKELQL